MNRIATYCGLFQVGLLVVTASRTAAAQPAPAPRPAQPAPAAPQPAAQPGQPSATVAPGGQAPAAATAPAPQPAPAPAPAPAGGEPAPVAAPPAEGAAPAAGVAAASQPAAAVAPAEPAPIEEVPAPHVAEHWYDRIEFGAFVDAYYSLNTNLPKPQGYSNTFRAFDQTNGFAMSWVGLDVSYAPDPVGGTINLRVGPSAAALAGPIDTENGLQFVKQGFASWRPIKALTFDFGKFDTVYGAEVADSQYDINYTRGILFTLGQPFFHAGLRGTYEFTEDVSATVLAVNGWNNTIDNNAGKSFGLVLNYTKPRADGGTLFGASAGYLVGAEQTDLYYASCAPGTIYDVAVNDCVAGTDGPTTFPVDRGRSNLKGLRHLLDVVLTLNPTEQFSLVVNGDYVREKYGTDSNLARTYTPVEWYGVMAAGRYAFTDVWALGARVEYFADPDFVACGQLCADLRLDDPADPDAETLNFVTATLTVEAAPTPNLIMKLDTRLDHSNQDVFQRIRTFDQNQFTMTLGVVATTN